MNLIKTWTLNFKKIMKFIKKNNSNFVSRITSQGQVYENGHVATKTRKASGKRRERDKEKNKRMGLDPPP